MNFLIQRSQREKSFTEKKVKREKIQNSKFKNWLRINEFFNTEDDDLDGE
jgi:hypothetical protein